MVIAFEVFFPVCDTCMYSNAFEQGVTILQAFLTFARDTDFHYNYESAASAANDLFLIYFRILSTRVVVVYQRILSVESCPHPGHLGFFGSQILRFHAALRPACWLQLVGSRYLRSGTRPWRWAGPALMDWTSNRPTAVFRGEGPVGHG